MGIARVFAEINALVDARVVETYAVGGAVGAVRYLEPFATQDVDIFVAFNQESSSLAPRGPIAAIALQTSRAKDKIRVTQFLEWEGFDRTGFDQIVSRHPGLLAKWDAFRAQFFNEP
ncbi:MAG: hypothetical protein ABIS29_01220 [Vicinamibacterales bacterium]